MGPSTTSFLHLLLIQEILLFKKHTGALKSIIYSVTKCKRLNHIFAVVVGSTKAQLQASSSNTKLLAMLHFNAEGQVDTSRVVDVAWIPGTNASLFAAAHLSGSIYVYQTVGPRLMVSSMGTGFQKNPAERQCCAEDQLGAYFCCG